MSDREHKSRCKLFCCNYARLGNVYEAALRSGFPPETALAEGTDIINRVGYRKLISNLMRKNIPPKDAVMIGLERLAFGRANDAARLVFSEEAADLSQIDSLDLFNVSEMKKVKGGGVEIKLFDRQKAMELIYQYESSKNASADAENLLEALVKGGVDSDNEV